MKILYFSGKNKGIDFEDKRRNGQVVSEDCPITRKSARRSGQHETTTGQYEMWNGKEMGTIGRNETTVRDCCTRHHYCWQSLKVTVGTWNWFSEGKVRVLGEIINMQFTKGKYVYEFTGLYQILEFIFI